MFEKKDDFQVHTNVDLCRSLNTSFETESGTTLVMHNTITTKFAQCRKPQFICMTPIVIKDMPKSRQTTPHENLVEPHLTTIIIVI